MLFLSMVSMGHASIELSDLRCEYRANPLGIDNRSPRFSWKITDAQKTLGQKQTAFQILVASSLEDLKKNKGNVWDSGKQSSDKSVNVLYAGNPLISNQKCYWKVRVWDVNGAVSTYSKHAFFSVGLLHNNDWKGAWIQKKNQEKTDQNWYRKTFTLSKAPTSGMVHLASYGYHELYVNGEKITENVMNPVLSYMKTRIPYLTYDIKDKLKKGNNVIAVWHAGGWTRWSRIREYRNPPFIFKAQAEIEVGKKALTIVTDASWKCKESLSKYIGGWDIQDFGGELIDARKAIPNWNTADYDDTKWEQAIAWQGETAEHLSAQRVEPQVRFQTLMPKVITGNGPYVIDMGTNYSGQFEIDLRNGKEGDTVTIEISDIKGVTCNKSQRSKYIFDKTGKGTFANRFNYAGGRWFTISGLNYKPDLKDIKGYVLTNDRKRISQFECSNTLLNQIYEININTLVANTLDGIMMDCPHRERRGWGEVTVAAMYGDAFPNFESGAYMDQYMQYMLDAQFPDGRTRAIVNEEDRPFLMWQANNPLTIWETYRTFGDIKILADNYESMEKWMDWLLANSNYTTGGALIAGEEGKREFPGLGDWATPHGNDFTSCNAPDAVHFNNCLYAYMLDIARSIASELGKTKDAAKYEDRLQVQRKATHRNSYNPETGNYGTGRQVDQAFALFSGVTPDSEKEKVYTNLVDKMLYGFPYYDVGSSGQALYTRYFIESGERMDLIYEVLTDKGHPSYGYFIAQGETTWPELWSSTGPSRIHTCYTGIGGYFIKGFGGIRIDPEHYGFQKFIIKPALVGDLTFANTALESLYGTIVSNWTKADDKATFHIEMPVNTTAKIYIPATSVNDVFVAGNLASKSEGIRYLGIEKNDAVGQYIIFEVGSGVYDVRSNALPKTTYPKPLYQGSNLALTARATASSMYYTDHQNPGFEAFRTNDNDNGTKWIARNENEQWLEMEWMQPKTFNKAIINELEENITSFTLQYWNGTNWLDITSGTTCGKDKVLTFEAITASKCRLYISKATKPVSISEFQIHGLTE